MVYVWSWNREGKNGLKMWMFQAIATCLDSNCVLFFLVQIASLTQACVLGSDCFPPFLPQSIRLSTSSSARPLIVKALQGKPLPSINVRGCCLSWKHEASPALEKWKVSNQTPFPRSWCWHQRSQCRQKLLIGMWSYGFNRQQLQYLFAAEKWCWKNDAWHTILFFSKDMCSRCTEQKLTTKEPSIIPCTQKDMISKNHWTFLHRVVWICISWFWDLQTTSFEIPWFLRKP